MRFTLIYTGDLKANAKPAHKHQLRKVFHSQLRTLWEHPPLSRKTYWYDGSKPRQPVDLNRRLGLFQFVPLVSPSLFVVCELRIFMLKPEKTGAIITQGGDIDNRLKTLFDSLRVPTHESELPKHAVPDQDEHPFFCLLEDDALITDVSVATDQLLVTSRSRSEVHLDIQVNTRPTQFLYRADDGGSSIAGGMELP